MSEEARGDGRGGGGGGSEVGQFMSAVHQQSFAISALLISLNQPFMGPTLNGHFR